MEYLFDYLLFFAKTITVVIFVFLPILLLLAISSRHKAHQKEHLEVNKLNKRYEAMADAINSTVMSKKSYKEISKQKKKQEKEQDKAVGKDEQTKPKNLYVIEFEGDIQASQIERMREEITAILTVAEAKDEVLVKIESPGGAVHAYGLAASQLRRIKSRDIHLTVTVDKVAASGGYLMACVADTIVAAPFAIVGSIGVLAQIPNFHRVLEKHDIEYNEFTAGEYKRTVGMFTPPTEKGTAKFKEEIEDTHKLFKDFIHLNRPKVDIDSVSTGEFWFGTRALERELVDKLMTSDQYLLEASKDFEIFEVKFIKKKNVMEKLKPAMAALLSLGKRNRYSDTRMIDKY